MTLNTAAAWLLLTLVCLPAWLTRNVNRGAPFPDGALIVMRYLFLPFLALFVLNVVVVMWSWLFS